MKNSVKNAFAEFSGWLGMILAQGALVPTTVSNIMGWSDKTPPVDMVIMIQIGLFLYFVRAVAQRDVLYMVSNGFGFLMQTILLVIMAF